MSNNKTPLPFDRKMGKEEFKQVEVKGIHNALRFLARECKTLGYTNTASLAQNAADTIFLELDAARKRETLSSKKRNTSPVRAVPKRAKLPRAVQHAFERPARARA